MSGIDKRFEQLRGAGRKAFIPFITAGDPDLEATKDLAIELPQHGADMIEIGFPYSDPIADGPVIQSSYTRALARGIHIEDIFNVAKEIHDEVETPLIGMVSYSLVFRHGPQDFVRQSAAAGFSGLIVPDLPVDEARDLSGLARSCDLSLILLTTPTTPPERVRNIVAICTGFLYCVSVAGITGMRTQLPAGLTDHLRRLRSQTDLPLCAGFGISTPEHVKLLRESVDGVIVGSAIVRLFEDMNSDRAGTLQKIAGLATAFSRALNV